MGFCVLRLDNNIVLTNFLFHLIGTDDDFYAYVDANERGVYRPQLIGHAFATQAAFRMA